MLIEKITNAKFKIIAVSVIFFALVFVPAPLLPPHRLAEAIQSMLGVKWKLAYLFAAIGLQTVFYGSLGILSALLVSRASTLQGRILKIIVMPVIIVLIGVLIRSVKMGHLPVWINAVIPIVACVFGVWLGLGFLYQRGKIILVILVAVLGSSFWLLSGGPDAALSHATEQRLAKLIASGSTLPSGDERFGALLQVAFERLSTESEELSVIQHNRAAILALGIVLGDERLARFVGINNESEVNPQIVQLRNGTTLRKRSDFPRHFCLSAALVVLENPLVSDAGGLMKEQLDALNKKGSGFSFRDFAANRAGVRFANAATNSEKDAEAMQEFLMDEFIVDNFLPPIDDLLEDLTVGQFRNEFGSVGSRAYRQKLNMIEKRLDDCVALSPLLSR